MKETDLYDVAIIGGGLAGLCLAIQCAGKNFKVILFEKEEYPFHKVCGEYISLESYNFLQRVGVNLNGMDLPIIKTLQLSDVKGECYSFDLPLGGFGISRYSLDNNLYEIALAKGVSIYTNNKVSSVSFDGNHFTITGADTIIRSKVAAGSFGKRSNLDIKWSRPFIKHRSNALNNYVGIKYHINYSDSPNQISLHNFYNGYCGLSKIENDKSCLCYLTTAKNLKDCGNSIAEMERKILYKNPRLKEIFSGASFLYERPLTISQISFIRKSQVENRVLMLGDAAGMISPLCGNGMSMAMHSSKLAYEAMQHFLSGKSSREEMERQYSINWKKEFSKRLWIGRTVQRFFGGNLTTSFFIRSMYTFPSLATQVIKATHGIEF